MPIQHIRQRPPTKVTAAGEMPSPEERNAERESSPEVQRQLKIFNLVIAFLSLKPTPSDVEFHQLAELVGITPEEFEAVTYKALGLVLQKNLNPEAVADLLKSLEDNLQDLAAEELAEEDDDLLIDPEEALKQRDPEEADELYDPDHDPDPDEEADEAPTLDDVEVPNADETDEDTLEEGDEEDIKSEESDEDADDEPADEETLDDADDGDPAEESSDEDTEGDPSEDEADPAEETLEDGDEDTSDEDEDEDDELKDKKAATLKAADPTGRAAQRDGIPDEEIVGRPDILKDAAESDGEADEELLRDPNDPSSAPNV